MSNLTSDQKKKELQETGENRGIPPDLPSEPFDFISVFALLQVDIIFKILIYSQTSFLFLYRYSRCFNSNLKILTKFSN